METKRELRMRIAELKQQLRIALVKAANLPPGRELACLECKHILWQQFSDDTILVLGCRSSNPCPDFVKSDNPIPITALVKKRQTANERSV